MNVKKYIIVLLLLMTVQAYSGSKGLVTVSTPLGHSFFKNEEMMSDLRSSMPLVVAVNFESEKSTQLSAPSTSYGENCKDLASDKTQSHRSIVGRLSQVSKVSDPLGNHFDSNQKMMQELRPLSQPILLELPITENSNHQPGENADVKMQIVNQLFNDNEKVACQYGNYPISEVVAIHKACNEKKEKYPIVLGDVALQEQHYAVLSGDETYMLSHIAQDKVFYGSDLEKFATCFAKLQKIDPRIRCPKQFTNTIKLYPSIAQRAHCYYNAQGNDAVTALGTLIGGWCIVDTAIFPFLKRDAMNNHELYLSQYQECKRSLQENSSLDGWQRWSLFQKISMFEKHLSDYEYVKNNNFLNKIKISFGVCGAFALMQAPFKYRNYKNDLKTIITNQPVLTASLEAIATKKSEV